MMMSDVGRRDVGCGMRGRRGVGGILTPPSLLARHFQDIATDMMETRGGWEGDNGREGRCVSVVAGIGQLVKSCCKQFSSTTRGNVTKHDKHKKQHQSNRRAMQAGNRERGAVVSSENQTWVIPGWLDGMDTLAFFCISCFSHAEYSSRSAFFLLSKLWDLATGVVGLATVDTGSVCGFFFWFRR